MNARKATRCQIGNFRCGRGTGSGISSSGQQQLVAMRWSASLGYSWARLHRRAGDANDGVALLLAVDAPAGSDGVPRAGSTSAGGDAALSASGVGRCCLPHVSSSFGFPGQPRYQHERLFM